MKKLILTVLAVWSSGGFAVWSSSARLASKTHTLRVAIATAKDSHGIVLLKRSGEGAPRFFVADFVGPDQSPPRSLTIRKFNKSYEKFQTWFEEMAKAYPPLAQCTTRLSVHVTLEQKEVHADELCFDLFKNEDAQTLNKWFESFEEGVASRSAKKTRPAN